MDTLTSPEPAPMPVMTPGPACTLCGALALVHWQRRLTDHELAAEQALETSRRDTAALLADPQQPRPGPVPLPAADDMTRLVHACGPHAITLEGAALIHASSCTAPNESFLPGCDCTPEVRPKEPVEAETALPAHWLPAGP